MTPLRHEGTVHVRRRGRGGPQELHTGAIPKPAPGRTPRVSKLVALALLFERWLHEGKVHDHAELARRGGVTRARISQILNLLNLAPIIQAEILLWPPIEAGRDPFVLAEMQAIASMCDWSEQIYLWDEFKKTHIR